MRVCVCVCVHARVRVLGVGSRCDNERRRCCGRGARRRRRRLDALFNATTHALTQQRPLPKQTPPPKHINNTQNKTLKTSFYNGYESRDFVTVDLVYLTLGHLRRPGAVLNVPKGTQDARSKQVAHADHLEEVKRSVMVVAELVDILGGEQRYLRRKVDRHIKTVVRRFWF